MSSIHPLISYTTQDRIAILRLNRPEKLNAFNRDLYRSLNQAFAAFLDDPELRVAVLLAEGKGFSGGLDLIDLQAAMAEAGTHDIADVSGDFSLAVEDAEFIDKPVIACLHGLCYGQGVTLALACDIRLAADDARLCLPEAKLGVASVHGTTRLMRMAPSGAALELLLTGEPRDAAWCHRAGIVNRLVPRDQLEAAGLELARQIAANPPAAVLSTRRVATASHSHSFADTVALGLQLRHGTAIDHTYTDSVLKTDPQARKNG